MRKGVLVKQLMSLEHTLDEVLKRLEYHEMENKILRNWLRLEVNKQKEESDGDATREQDETGSEGEGGG